MELIDVVMKLTGPISPAGDSAIDRERISNLNEVILLAEKLLFRIHEVSHLHDSPLDSVKKMGQKAKQFLDDLKETD